jgi:hypothetical protein
LISRKEILMTVEMVGLSENTQYHEAANLFPLIEGKDFDELVEDIRGNGLRLPIALFDGKIIDGRNRYKACGVAGVEPRFCEADLGGKSPVDYVVSLNLKRRQLTESQLSLVAPRIREFYDKEAKERQRAGGGDKRSEAAKQSVQDHGPEPKTEKQARDAVGAVLGISGRTVDRGTKVFKRGTPELIAAVEAGQVTVTRAEKLLALSPEEQKAAIARPKRGKRSESLTAPSEPPPWKTKSFSRKRIEQLVALVENAYRLVDKPLITVSVVDVRISVCELREYCASFLQ